MAVRALFPNNIALSSRMIHLRSASRPLFGEVRRETEVGEKRGRNFFSRRNIFPDSKLRREGQKGIKGWEGRLVREYFSPTEAGFEKDSVTKFEEVSTVKDH